MAHAVIFLSITTITSFVCFRVACTLIYNYYEYHEFCFSGRVHGYFLFTITIARFVFSSGGVCGYF